MRARDERAAITQQHGGRVVAEERAGNTVPLPDPDPCQKAVSFSPNDIARFLLDYDLGAFRGFRPVPSGVQTVLLVTTTKGRYAMKYYGNRSFDSVCLETRITHYLRGRGYPCPAPLRRQRGGFVGV